MALRGDGGGRRRVVDMRVRTGAGGSDASSMFARDPGILGELRLVPTPRTGRAVAVESETGYVVGYAVATLDTGEFCARIQGGLPAGRHRDGGKCDPLRSAGGLDRRGSRRRDYTITCGRPPRGWTMTSTRRICECVRPRLALV